MCNTPKVIPTYSFTDLICLMGLDGRSKLRAAEIDERSVHYIIMELPYRTTELIGTAERIIALGNNKGTPGPIWSFRE